MIKYGLPIYLNYFYFQEFSAVDEVWIHSEGMVILDSDLHIEQNTTDDVYQVSSVKI